MKKLLLLTTLVLGVIAFALPGQAAPVNYECNVLFGDSIITPSGWFTANFVDDGSVGGFSTVKATFKSNYTLGLGEKIEKWYINLNPDYSPTSLNFSVLSSAVSPFPTISKGANSYRPDGDGLYDVIFQLSPDASDPFDGTDEIVYKIAMTGVNLTPEDFNYFSAPGPGGSSGPFLGAVHYMGLGDDNKGSSWGGAVPIPASVLLLGSGLAGLVGFRRKKIAK